MREWRQVITGFFMAVLFSVILLGSISLSLAESGFALAQAPTITPTFPPPRKPPPTVINIMPSGPGFTPSPTLAVTETPTPTPIPPTNCPPPLYWIPIEVQEGETLSILADRFNVLEDELASGNCLEPGFTLMKKTILWVPPRVLPTPWPTPTRTRTRFPTPVPTYCPPPPIGWVPYTVRRGDYLYSISLAHGTTVQQLVTYNCLDSYTIYPGQVLYVPYRPPTAYPTPTYLLPSFTPSATFFYPSATPTPTPTLPSISTATSTATATHTPVPPTNTPKPTNTLPYPPPYPPPYPNP